VGGGKKVVWTEWGNTRRTHAHSFQTELSGTWIPYSIPASTTLSHRYADADPVDSESCA
jgi:hypothetical protein